MPDQQGYATHAFLPGQPLGALASNPPPLTDLVLGNEFEILGSELVGDRKEFDVDPELLPVVPYDWQLAYFYLYNGQGSTGRPSGTWQFQIFTDKGDGLGPTWHEATKPYDIQMAFDGGTFQRMVKPQMDYRVMSNWMSGDGDGGIKYGIVCIVPPTLGAAKLIAGVTGKIYLN
jgi:hypothetical protein